jgi:hypothetical protein
VVGDVLAPPSSPSRRGPASTGRYDSTTVQRGGGPGSVPARVHRRPHDLSGNGDASQRLGDLVEREVLAKEPHAGLEVTLDAYLANGSNYETEADRALDRVLGRDENYDVLFESAVEAIREHPGTYFRGVADTFWDFLMQAPLREDVAPREQTAPEAPPPAFESAGVALPNPQAHVLLEAVPYGFVWCASDYIDSCTVERPSLVWEDPASQRRYREIVSQVRSWDADLPSRGCLRPELLNRGSRHATWRYPCGSWWGAVALRSGVPAAREPSSRSGSRPARPACARCLPGRRPEFALPLYRFSP